MMLEDGEFVGASVPEHFFQARQGCRECRQTADFTVLIGGAWGGYRKVSLCDGHWQQMVKQPGTEKFAPFKLPAAPKPEPGREGHKPGKVVTRPIAKLKHAALTFMFFLAGAATAVSQTGQLAVTARIETSATYRQEPDGKWTLTVANGNDPDAMFAPKHSKTQALKSQVEKHTPPAVRQQKTGGRTCGPQKSISQAGC